VKAPLSGYITQLNVKPTDNVSPGFPLFTVSNLDLIEAQIWASSKEADQIKVGQKVTLEWDGKLIEGSVIQVNQIMDVTRKAFEVKALFKNPDKVLTSGITADISIRTYNNAQAVVVSRKNLIEEDGKRFVYVVSNGKAVKREIMTGKEQGALIEVKAGLKPGEFIITEGNKMVEDQIKVKIINS
jgi:RND family efflux transporter MFP subunit